MRVTQFTQYNNFILNQQNTLSELNKVQTQISTGVKIENMYDDPAVYTKYLKLNEETNSFTQIKSSASFAKTFANETDTVLNNFVSTLGSFKTKLLNAANDTNNETSRNAIVSELEGELEHLKDLANTSIDGKYLFSGSKFNTKPINDNYKYQGNGDKVKAFLGAGVEREYNIDGNTLFLGRDNDYVKHISTNVVQFDKMKANPEFVVRGSDGKLYIDKHLKDHGKTPDSNDVPKNEPVTGESQIRMITGVEDVYNSTTDTYSDGTSYFYIKGKKPNGESINTKISLSNSDTVNDLLEKIGEIYGNTATSKSVDVSLNDMGQIQIKDVNSGKLITDFFMVASDKDEDSVEDLVKNGDYLVSFQESNFKGAKSLNSISADNGYFDNRIFKFGSKLFLDDNSREALPSDTLDKVFGEGVTEDNRISKPDFIHITGTDPDGNSVDDTFNIYDSNNNAKTVNDLLNEIKTAFGGDDKVDVKLEKGEIIITDKTLANKNDSSKLTINLTAYEDTDNDGTLETTDDKKINIFRSKDLANENKNYLSKDGNTLTSNVSQVVKDKTVYFKNGEKLTNLNDVQNIASNNSVLMDTMGDDAVPKKINLEYKNIDGKYKKAAVELRDSIKTMTAKYEADTNKQIIYDPSGKSNQTDKYYDIMGVNVIDKDEKPVAVKYLKVSDGNTTTTIAINENTTFKDIVDNSNNLLTGYSNGKFTTANSNVTITLEDENQNDIVAGFKSNYQVDLNNDGKINYGEIFNIFNQKGELTPAHTHINTVTELDPTTCKVCNKDITTKGVTYRQLGDVVSMLTSKNISSDSPDVYSKNVNQAADVVDVNLDDKGRMVVNDKTSNPTNVELAMYGTSLSSSNFTSIGDKVNNSGSDQTFTITVDGTDYSMNVTDGESVKSFMDDINNGNLKDSGGNSLDVKAYYKNGSIYLDFTKVNGEITNINDTNLNTHFKYRDDNSLSVYSNNAVTIDDPQTDFFETLQQAIDAVKNGNNYPDSEKNPRNFGIQGAIEAIDHVTDHVRRSHAKIGAVSNEFDLTIERVDMLKLNVQQLQSDNIDTDIGEATMRLNSLQTSYQALLASVAKINKITLLNYL